MPGRLYERQQDEERWEAEEEEVTAANLGAEGLMPVVRRTLTAAFGRNNACRSNSLRHADDDEWTIVSLLP